MQQCRPPTAGEKKIDGALTKAANGFCMSDFYKAKYTREPAQIKAEFCTVAAGISQ